MKRIIMLTNLWNLFIIHFHSFNVCFIWIINLSFDPKPQYNKYPGSWAGSFFLYFRLFSGVFLTYFFEKPFNRKLIRLFYSDLFANWQKTWSAGEWEKKKEIINLIRNRNWIWIMKNSFAKKENLSNEKIPITHYWKEKTSKVFWYFNLFGTKKFDILNSTQRKKELQGVYVCQ